MYKIAAKLWFSIKNKNNFNDFILSKKMSPPGGGLFYI
ncbi:hypothetical protein FORMA_12420 [Formosa sp. Hel3_A1_48]|nr:hypothetical protein FORMA_12420 [Formosa sp. Hel3_A1_48]